MYELLFWAYLIVGILVAAVKWSKIKQRTDNKATRDLYFVFCVFLWPIAAVAV